MKFICTFTILAFFVTGCSDYSSNFSNQNARTVSSPETIPRVASLCQLFDNPYPYQRKLLRLKTTVSTLRTGNNSALFGDENCEQRHPLIDVEFSPELEASVCKKENAEQEKLCAAIGKTGNDLPEAKYEIVAEVVGYFEYYETNEGFTRNGMRFRFRVDRIENIEKITPIEVINLK